MVRIKRAYLAIPESFFRGNHFYTKHTLVTKFTFRPKKRYYSNNINPSVKVFTPLNFNHNLSERVYSDNIKRFGPQIDSNACLKNTLIHVKTLQDYKIQNTPTYGSFIHFETDNPANEFGIVVSTRNFSLSKPTSFMVLLPSSEIVEVFNSKIIFTIQLMEHQVSLPQLAYTLNVFLAYYLKIQNFILDKDLIRTAYLKAALINYQTSIQLQDFSLDIYNSTKSIRNLLNLKINPFSAHSFIFACHYMMYNDPIHFRYVSSLKPSMYTILNPLLQLTTPYFLNPIVLSENIETIYNQPNEAIRRSYYNILTKSTNFQIFNILKSDENFKKLILFIKYAIVYPNPKLFNKLDEILPLKATSTLLLQLLKKLEIYNHKTNPILASGMYGLHRKDPTDLSMYPQVVADLQYSEQKAIKAENLPSALKRHKPLLQKKSYKPQFTEMINSVKYKIWDKSKIHSKVYKLTDTIAFSVTHVSLTCYRFGIFVPIPNQSPNENITIIEPIKTGNINSFPKLIPFNQYLRVNQPCIKLTFEHDLIHSDSLTSPKIKVGIDMFKKIEDIDEDWFRGKKQIHVIDSRKKMECWSSMNKLSNLLVEKEKSRIRHGLLKTFGGLNEKNNDLKRFTDYQQYPQFDDNFDDLNHHRDKSWLIENLKLLIDENFSRFCNEKKIKVLNRSITKSSENSDDYRVFKKLKIFKWYANSYDTFNFQLSSNPGDLTAYFGCLSFLSKCEISDKGYLPLGLKHYSSFTSLEFIETHLNLWQLLRYLLVEAYKLIKNEKAESWDPEELEKVTAAHFKHALGQTEGYVQIINRLNRYESLSRIKNEGALDEMMRCVVTEIHDDKILGYWIDEDLQVEIESSSNYMIGDRIICSNIVEIDPLSDKIVVK